MDENHMWTTSSLLLDDLVRITVTFNTELYVTGMRLWNYNPALDLSYCGVRSRKINCND